MREGKRILLQGQKNYHKEIEHMFDKKKYLTAPFLSAMILKVRVGKTAFMGCDGNGKDCRTRTSL